MAKRDRRAKKREPATEATEAEREIALGYAITREAVNQHLDEVPEPPLPGPPPVPAPDVSALQSIRERTIQGRKDTAQTIANLEEWRAEIDATIALLRAR